MGQSYLEKETGYEEDDTRWAELHVLHEDSQTQEGQFSQRFQDEQKREYDDENFTNTSYDVHLRVQFIEVAVSKAHRIRHRFACFVVKQRIRPVTTKLHCQIFAVPVKSCSGSQRFI